MVLALGLIVVTTAPSSADDGGLDAAKRRANAAAQALNVAVSKASELSDQVADLEQRAAAAAAQLEAVEAAVRDLAVSRYIGAEQSTRMLASSDINRQVQADALYKIVTHGNEDAVDRYRALKADLDEANAALSAKLDAQKKAVAAARKQQAAVDAELRRLTALEAARAAAAARAKGGRLAAAPSGPIASGAWICPVQGPHAFGNDFGAPRPGGRRHQGNDILSPRGTPVVAPVSGVSSQRTNSLGGLTFWLVGDDGNSYYGAHLDSWSANTGRVAAGTVLGYVGNTGDAAGGPTHLHFEIHPHGGGAVNPYPTLLRYC